MDQVTPTTDFLWPNFDDYDNFTMPPDVSMSQATPCLQDDIYIFAQRYSPVMYSLVFFLAVIGNVLVLCVIRRYRSSQSGGACAFSLTDTFLLHLAISDLLLAFTLPLFAVQWAHEWVFGLAVCKISGALFSLNRYSGILFLACISFDRYLAIVHAVSSGWKRNTCHAQIACALIWVGCLGLSGVDITFKQVVTHDLGHHKAVLCQVWFTDNPEQWQVGLQLVSVILGFGLPLLIMLYCYIRIFRSLCNATRRQKRKSLRLIISLVSVFVISWAPYNCFQLADSLQMLGFVKEDCQFGRAVDIGTLITESVGLSHCALNPLLYGFVGVKFRRELARMCKGLLAQRGWQGMEGWRERRLRRTTASCSSKMSMDVELDGLFRHNTTYDYDDNYEYKDDFEPRDSNTVLIPLLYSVELVIDILLLATLPFWAAQATQRCGWCFSGFLCKICGAVFDINFYCGILLLGCICLDRYLSIVHAIQLYSRNKPWLVHISCLSVWILSLSATDWQLVSRLLHHMVGFLMPTAALIVCCTCVLPRLQSSIKGIQKQRSNVVILLLLAVFFLCWTPYNITLIVGHHKKQL
ncbi:C-X-C chemokine receptor type 3-2 [Collichthys lucidus]|uniref:C-X-C chemokine receptor type 3-2 n=1 Tax=Collichthys lucidus TaxID=240159 RepID=A0A4V6XYU5_COLLU|nr:C-X-C chemokine receptor type 3-2 [Collichthys lucidus]